MIFPFNKILILLFIILIAITINILGLGEYLNLASLKLSHVKLQNLYNTNPLFSVSAFLALYILIEAVSFPGAAVLGLAAGAIFGITAGVVIVLFAAVVSAALAFMISRYLLRNYFERRFGTVYERIEKGIEADGEYYLFILRIFPFIPFFLINILMGLTHMPLSRFCLISFAGMIPGAFLFVNAGRELGRLESVSGIMSPSLIISLLLLGIFPLFMKQVVKRRRRGREGS